MAKNKRDFGVEFVNLRLSTKDKKEVDAWIKKQEYSTADFMEALIQQEYKVSLSHDPDNACFIVAVTGKPNHPVNAGKCLTSRAPTIDEALWVTAYKHIVICAEGNWGESDTAINAYG